VRRWGHHLSRGRGQRTGRRSCKPMAGGGRGGEELVAILVGGRGGGRRDGGPFPRSVSVTNVMNTTCIHMGNGGPNIYMYRRRKYIENPLEKYNNRKPMTHLILPSNSWWINNTKFGEVKLIMGASLSLREEICQLEL
jgi:hypothetical protein